MKRLKYCIALSGLLLICSSVLAEDGASTGGGSADGAPDTANVINPDEEASGSLNGDGIVKLEMVADEAAKVYRSGDLVERIALFEKEGCLTGEGQIGTVSRCDGKATLQLSGRPEFVCPLYSAGVYGPCQLPEAGDS